MDEDNQIDDGQQAGTNGYDPDAMGDVLTEDQYRNSPQWFKERMGHMARQKNEAKEQAENFRAELDRLRGEVGEIRSLSQTQPRAVESNEDKPFVQRATEQQLREAATRIMGLQELARDPDAAPEERAKAREQLSNLGDAPSVLFDIHQEIADRKASKAAGSIREEFTQREAMNQARNQLVQGLFTKHGQDAINPKSDLSKAAFQKLQTWTKEYGITADQVSDFMTIKAFEEAAAELRTSAPGRRGADPRTSPVLGATGSRNRDGDDQIAALERRAQQGDWQARRKASTLKFESWLSQTGLKGGSD